MDRSPSKQRIIGLIVAASFLVQALDAFIVATALPQMAVSLNTNAVHLSVAITAYLLALAVAIPLAGWLCDRFGARNVFAAALFVFTLGSVMCGFSSDIVTLTVARIIQGVGGAMLSPVGRMVLLNNTPKAEFVRATTWLQIMTMIGSLLGPPVGGFITTYFSWRWIFLLNVPLGIAGMVGGLIYIDRDDQRDIRPLDWLGFLFSGVLLCCFMYAMEILSHDAEDPMVPWLFAASLVFAVAAWWHGRNEPHPIIDYTLMRARSYSVNITGGSLYRFGAGAMVYLLPLLLQLILELDAFEAGMMMLVGAMGAMAISFCATRILRYFSFRTVLTWNALFCAITMILYGLMAPGTPYAILIPLLFVGGFVRSLEYMYLNSLAYADVAATKLGAATTFASMVQQLCNGVGVAMAAIALHLCLSWRHDTKLAISDFQVAFVIAGAMVLAAIPIFRSLAPDAGDELRGLRK